MSILRKVDKNIWFVIHCPTCNQKHSVGVVTVAEAIEHKSPIKCFACKGEFFIEVTCPTRDAQLRIGADDAGHDCPLCGGKRVVPKGDTKILCPACTVTVQS